MERRERKEFKLGILSFRCMVDVKVKIIFNAGRKKVRE